MVLNVLDQIQVGLYAAVFVLPSASTWTRLRLQSDGGQPLRRSRSEPHGISGLHSTGNIKDIESEQIVGDLPLDNGASLHDARLHTSGSCLCSQKTSEVRSRQDHGRPWALNELRELHGVSGAARGGSLHVRDRRRRTQRRPLGSLTNLEAFKKKLHLGWPSLLGTDSKSVLRRPSPKTMSLHHSHVLTRCNAHSLELRISWIQTSLGIHFWRLAGTCLLHHKRPDSLRVEVSHYPGPLNPTSEVVPSLAEGPGPGARFILSGFRGASPARHSENTRHLQTWMTTVHSSRLLRTPRLLLRRSLWHFLRRHSYWARLAPRISSTSTPSQPFLKLAKKPVAHFGPRGEVVMAWLHW